MANKNETREQFLEKLFFDIFLTCIVLKDSKLFNFEYIKTITKTDNLPIQTTALIESFKKDAEKMSSIELSNKYFFIMYMNYQNLFQIEYFDDKLQKWNLLTEQILNTLPDVKVLCRVVSFINEELSIVRSESIDIELVNQYFILSNQ